jgi:sugar-specific transcriptional regulator TrmB
MIDESELLDGLEHLGFSRQEARIYLFVAEHGRTDLARLASVIDSSMGFVRRACDRLQANGLLTVDGGSPTTVRARPSVDELDDRAFRLAELVSTLNRRYTRDANPVDTIDVLKPGADVHQRAAELIVGADREIMLSASANDLAALAGPLDAALDRDVLVVLVIGQREGVPRHAASGSVVRTTPHPLPIVLSVDKRRGVLSPSSVVSTERIPVGPLAFDNYTVASTVLGFFLGTLWQPASELAIRRPVSLPHEYGNRFWKAVLDATLHRQANRPLRARATVRTPQGQDEPTTLTGRVVDTRQRLVEPTTGAFPLEHGIFLDTGGRVVSLGGSPGAFKEAYETTSITLLDGDNR